ncbi:hypothetical protein F5883DRAFT_613771 [Diaporthe sp. PMI_573]|nr:hypothetical protein F5883DRAFT_613771 [Diaporthaceae sp. PMI_573]
MEFVMADPVGAGPTMEDILQFLTANPSVFYALKSIADESTSKAVSSRDHKHMAEKKKYARNIHSMLLNLVANSNLELVDSGNIPESTKASAERIRHAQYEVPLRMPLPLFWSADHGTPSARPRAASEDSDSSDSSDDSGHKRNNTDDLVRRLAVSVDPNFAYPPELFKIRPDATDAAAGDTHPPAATLPRSPSWSYGTLYTVGYEEDATTDEFREKLAQMNLKLPEIVLNLGRLVVTSKLTNNPDGSNWSPSDYTVMVDMQSESKPVWLLCDSHASGWLRRLNHRDGTQWDIDRVRQLFDRRAMDLALLYPRIDDWESSKNTWPALQARISQTAMKLGLRLLNL